MDETTITPEMLDAAVQQSVILNGLAFSISFYMDRLHKEFGVSKEEMNAGLKEALQKWKEEGGEKSNWVTQYKQYMNS